MTNPQQIKSVEFEP